MKRPTTFNEERLRKHMDSRGIDLVILRTPENSKYVSEFVHLGGLVGYRPFVVFFFRDPAIKPAMVVPAVDLHLAMDMSWIDDVRGYAMAEFFTDLNVAMYEDFFAAAKDILAERRIRNMTVGIENDQLTAGFQKKMEDLLDGNKIVDCSWDLDIVRMVKTSEEVRRLKVACDITIGAHESFRAAIKIGASDSDLYKAAAGRMFADGAEGFAHLLVAVGQQYAYAAHLPYPVGAKVGVGDFVKVDMGAVYKGYPSDFVRCYFAGKTSDRHIEIWNRLNEVQVETGLALKPGMTGGEIFDRSYAHISKYLPKFPREFIGHGLGFSPHEQPRMNHVNKTVLEGNSVVCLEHSYYHEGVRHHTEDTFFVRADNVVEHWTASCPRELVVEV